MRGSLRAKSNLLFIQIISLGTIIFLLLTGLILKIYNYAFSATGEFFLSKATAACGCQTFISTSHNTLIAFFLFFGAAIITTITIAVGRVIFSVIKTNNFVKLQKTKQAKNSAQLAQITQLLSITGQVEEIESKDLVIFCYGILKPKICISSRVVDLLNPLELQAVLLHEMHHLISYEPARLLAISFINTFIFIPGIKGLTRKYLSFSELAADELATNNFTKKLDLARAMRKILALKEKTTIQKGMSLSYFSQVTEDRVRALSENDYTPACKREIIKVSFGIAMAAIIFFYFSSEIKAQTVFTRQFYADSPCAGQILKIEACQNGWTNCKDKVFHEKKINCENTLQYLKTK